MSEAEKLTIERINDVKILLRQEKPGDRSERDRHFAILLTEAEKFEALYRGLIIPEEEVINE